MDTNGLKQDSMLTVFPGLDQYQIPEFPFLCLEAPFVDYQCLKTVCITRAPSGVVPVRLATLATSVTGVNQREPVGTASPTPATPVQSASFIERVKSSVR